MHMRPTFVQYCPTCGAVDNVEKINTESETVECCHNCTATWNKNQETMHDPREGLSEGEILKKGWFVTINYN